LSKLWVFTTSTLKNKKKEFLIFLLIGIIGLLLNNLFLWIFTKIFALHYMISKLISTALVYFWNFFAWKYILFNKEI